MKSIWSAIVVAAPLTAVLLLLALEQRAEVGTRLERGEVQSRLDGEQFDRDFNRAWGVAPDASVEIDRGAQLQRLEDERNELDRRLKQNLQRLNQDSVELRQALDELDAADQTTPKSQPRR